MTDKTAFHLPLAMTDKTAYHLPLAMTAKTATHLPKIILYLGEVGCTQINLLDGD